MDAFYCIFQDSVRQLLSSYLHRFSTLAGPVITCGPVLNWLELDNRGHRLIVTDDCAINTPAVAAAYAIKRYAKQASDEISFEVGVFDNFFSFNYLFMIFRCPAVCQGTSLHRSRFYCSPYPLKVACF